ACPASDRGVDFGGHLSHYGRSAWISEVYHNSSGSSQRLRYGDMKAAGSLLATADGAWRNLHFLTSPMPHTFNLEGRHTSGLPADDLANTVNVLYFDGHVEATQIGAMPIDGWNDFRSPPWQPEN